MINFLWLLALHMIIGCGKSGDKPDRTNHPKPTASLQSGSGKLYIHYRRPWQDYEGFTVQVGGEGLEESQHTTIDSPLEFSNKDGWGAIATIKVTNPEKQLTIKVHKGLYEDPFGEYAVTPKDTQGHVYLVQGVQQIFLRQGDASEASLTLGQLFELQQPSSQASTTTRSLAPKNWTKGASFYQLAIRSFQDSDGNGFGDILGATSRLPYLRHLGVKAILLSSVFESSNPLQTAEPTSHRKIDPSLGTEEDLQLLINTAHNLGMAVLMSYEANYSSIAHPLFMDAVTTVENPKHTFYRFKELDYETWNQAGGFAYYGKEGPLRPEFNFKNPDVIKYHISNLEYWLNRGVDGFYLGRIDHLVEDDADNPDIQGNLEVLAQINRAMMTYENRQLICGVTTDPKPYSDSGLCDIVAGGSFYTQMIRSFISGQRPPELFPMIEGNPAPHNFALYLSSKNGDSGQRIYSAIDEGRRYNLLRVTAAIQMTLPGHPFIFYGDEIGLSGLAALESPRQKMKPPMSWGESDELNDGFSKSQEIFRPLADNSHSHNAAEGRTNPHSLFNEYRKLLQIKNRTPSLQTGHLESIEVPDGFLGFRRILKDEETLVLINLMGKQKQIEVSHLPAKSVLIELANGAKITVPSSGKWNTLIEPFSYRFYVTRAKRK